MARNTAARPDSDALGRAYCPLILGGAPVSDNHDKANAVEAAEDGQCVTHVSTTLPGTRLSQFVPERYGSGNRSRSLELAGPDGPSSAGWMDPFYSTFTWLKEQMQNFVGSMSGFLDQHNTCLPWRQHRSGIDLEQGGWNESSGLVTEPPGLALKPPQAGMAGQSHQDAPVSGLVGELQYDPHPGNPVDRENFPSAAVLQDPKVETRLSSCEPGQGPPQPSLLSTDSESASSRGPKAVPTSTPSEGAKYCNSQDPPVNAVPRNARPGNQRPKSQDSILSLNRYLNQPGLYEGIVDEACGTNPGSAIEESTTSFTPCPPTSPRADVPRNRPAGTRPRGSTGSSTPQISEFEIQSESRNNIRESGVFGRNSNPLRHRDGRLRVPTPTVSDASEDGQCRVATAS